MFILNGDGKWKMVFPRLLTQTTTDTNIVLQQQRQSPDAVIIIIIIINSSRGEMEMPLTLM